VSQFNQRSVQDERGGQGHGEHQMNLVPSNKERHMMRRSVDRHRMRRQMDAVPYPSKEAYDSYVVNNYRNTIKFIDIHPSSSIYHLIPPRLLPLQNTNTTSHVIDCHVLFFQAYKYNIYGFKPVSLFKCQVSAIAARSLLWSSNSEYWLVSHLIQFRRQ
jgi:hypothetical protein